MTSTVEITRTNPDALKRILKNVARMKGAKVEVGVLSDKNHTKAGMSVKKLAAIHELGSVSANIPARPFVEPTMRDNRFEYRRMMFEDAKNLAKGRKDPKKSLSQIGEMAVEDMKMKILDGQFAPLKPRTVLAKGHDQPLIDTGQLYDAIEYKVTVK